MVSLFHLQYSASHVGIEQLRVLDDPTSLDAVLIGEEVQRVLDRHQRSADRIRTFLIDRAPSVVEVTRWWWEGMEGPVWIFNWDHNNPRGERTKLGRVTVCSDSDKLNARASGLLP